MAIRNILHHPDPRLRIRAEPVDAFNPELEALVADMFETMYDAPGIGLAATQINVHQRVLVVDVSREGSQPMHFVNPEILSREGEISMDEGCLSVPEIFEPVTRAERIIVSAKTMRNEPLNMEVQGLLAVCIQHEIDHLDGKLFVDYLSQLKQQRIRKKLEKAQRLAS
ncbi:MAG: peptide deformylase [Pseudomonadota bacterium]